MAYGRAVVAMLALPALACASADAAPDQAGGAAQAGDEVVVIARRMRLVSVDYALNGPYLVRCDITQSSGDRRIDRIMCAVLSRCIKAGYRAPAQAKRCMDASIAAFAAGTRQPPDPDVELGTAAAAPLPVPSPRPSPPLPAPSPTADVVVRARPVRIDGGLWHFVAQSVSASGRPMIRGWQECIAPGEPEAMMRRMVGGEETRGPEGRCGPMKLRFGGGTVTGERACLFRGSRFKTRLTGSFDRDRMATLATTYLVISNFRTANEGAGLPDDDSLSKISGERIGTCDPAAPASPAPAP